MKILVTGGDGQLGRALQKVLPQKNSVFTTRADFDITNQKQTIKQIAGDRPNIVIHAAAYTNVDGCEQNPEIAYKVNVDGTKNIAAACKEIGAKLIYISTDFVFDGKKKTPYSENDKPNPLSVYGKTKLQGEEAVKKLPDYIIIRTSWLFGDGPAFAKASAGKQNFVQTILKLVEEKDEIKVVNDQIGSPTYALDLAEAIYQLIKNCSGIYHISNSGQCSWHQFAQEIMRQKGFKTKILPINSGAWQKMRPDSAKRPKYSVLSHKKINTLGIRTSRFAREPCRSFHSLIKMRPWQDALRDYLETIS